ncbi:hypothetical protein E2C01_100370 [Portunus trituberculatus]|uniref:Uncharacterized protein n=1 Tax=Portunus trituberculatus TaxID=210409 RepID=A0A5B7K6T5_PORTR|nr:hypothetical protein [Portunus trituberculatus]
MLPFFSTPAGAFIPTNHNSTMPGGALLSPSATLQRYRAPQRPSAHGPPPSSSVSFSQGFSISHYHRGKLASDCLLDVCTIDKSVSEGNVQPETPDKGVGLVSCHAKRPIGWIPIEP